jgi:predicted nucleic acid-binding protein
MTNGRQREVAGEIEANLENIRLARFFGLGSLILSAHAIARQLIW